MQGLQCPNITAILDHDEEFWDDVNTGYSIGGTDGDKLRAYYRMSLNPCQGSDCETDPDKIASYFKKNPISMVWFDSFIAEDKSHDTSDFYQD